MAAKIYSLDYYTELDHNFREYIRRRLVYSSAAEAADEQRKEYDQRLISMLNDLYKFIKADVFELDIHEGERVRIRKAVRSGSKYLSYDKLVELGIKSDILDMAWETRADSQPFVEIRHVKAN